MDPIPEVRGELDRLSALLGDGLDVGGYLRAVADVAQALVPSCVGGSITVIIDGDAYTMTATTLDAAQLDAAQVLDGGPCVEALTANTSVVTGDILDEHRWQLFGQAAAAKGVRSSLSFPIRDVDDLVAGGVNVYASEPDAFADDRSLLMVGLGGDLSEVVVNADLSFRTREYAQELSARLDAKAQLETAVGIMMARRGWNAEQARDRLARAAAQAGVPREAVVD